MKVVSLKSYNKVTKLSKTKAPRAIKIGLKVLIIRYSNRFIKSFKMRSKTINISNLSKLIMF